MMTDAEDTQKIYRNYVGCFVEWCRKDTIVSNTTAKTFEDYICIKSKVAIPKYERVLKEPYTDDEMKLLLASPKSLLILQN